MLERQDSKRRSRIKMLRNYNIKQSVSIKLKTDFIYYT